MQGRGRLQQMLNPLSKITDAQPITLTQVARNAAAAAQTAAEAAGGGVPPTMLYEAASAAIPSSTGLIAGNVECPEIWARLEFYFRASN